MTGTKYNPEGFDKNGVNAQFIGVDGNNWSQHYDKPEVEVPEGVKQFSRSEIRDLLDAGESKGRKLQTDAVSCGA